MSAGSIASINVSGGGVPKLPVQECRILPQGLEGDRQRDLRFHGGPDRAVSLYSLERILALQAEGHPIVSGSIGENLTLAGLDWNLVVPGARMRVGDALLELTRYAAPCRNITGSFADGNMNRVSAKLHPGWGRLYARVIEEGLVRVGDPAALL